MAKARKPSQSDIDAQIIGEQQQQQQQRQRDVDSLQTLGQGPARPAIGRIPKLKTSTAQPTSIRERQPAGGNQPISGSQSAARGKGATRGGHVGRRNVFERREPPKKRRTLIENASDPNQEQKLFPNWHMRRKAELAARGIADSAPDVAALGGLVCVSDPSLFQPLRPATLRKQSAVSIPQVSDSLQPPIEPEEPNNHDSFILPTVNRPTYDYDRHGDKAVCYFWHYRGDCSKGPACRFLHYDDPALPIVPTPNKISQGITELDNIRASHPQSSPPPPSRRRTINEICHYWHRSGACKKGADCTFVHDNSADLPIAPGPRQSHQGGGSTYRPIYDRQLAEGDRPAADYRLEPESRENNGAQTGIPLDSNTSYGPPALEEDVTMRTESDSSMRPPWDARDPFKSICYFWHTLGSCAKKESGCKFVHSDQSDLPLAPQPYHKTGTPCRFWLIGDCRMGDRCPYLHSSRSLDPRAPVAIPTGPRNGVSFAIDDPEPPLDSLVPTGPKVNRDPRPEITEAFDKPCAFFARNDCFHGESCWYSHDQPKEPGTANGGAGLSRLEPPAYSELANDVHPRSLNADHPRTLSLSGSERSALGETATMGTKAGGNTLKLNLEEYRNRNAGLVNNRAKEIIFGHDEPQSIVVDFGDIGDAAQEAWGQVFVARPTFYFHQVCTAQDFGALSGFLLCAVLWNGSLTANPTDKAAVDKLNKFSQNLRLYSGGLISVSADFVILIYPAMEEWKVIKASTNLSPEDRLRYLIFRPSVDIKRPVALKGEAPTLFKKTLAKSLHGLRYRQFLHSEKSDQVHHFYLMFPSKTSQTASFFASWLRASDSRCKVYSSETEGAWNFFVTCREIQAGVVLIHESVVSNISDLPWLFRLITPSNPGKMFTFWCIDDSSKQYPIFQSPTSSSLGHISVVRIFPHGHAIFLTPSFLVAEPESARILISWFRNKIRKVTPGTWKIVCAYEIRAYLLQLAIEKASERDEFYEQNKDKPAKDAMAAKRGLSYQACEARFKCHAMIADILEESMKDRLLESYDSDQADNIANTIVYADESIDPDDEPSLITWFAAWSIRHLDKFRKYTVVGTNSASHESAVRIKALMLKGKAGSGTPSASNSSLTGGSPVTLAQPGVDNHSASSLSVDTKTTSPAPVDGTGESGIASELRYAPRMVASPAQEAGPISIQDEKSPQKQSPGFVDWSAEMDTSPDGDGSIVSEPCRTVDPESAPDILLFCATTGCNVQTAREYLVNANIDFQQAVRLFGIHNSRDRLDWMDADAHVVELIHSVQAERTRQLPRVPLLVTETTGSHANATGLGANSQVGVQSLIKGAPKTSAFSPACDPSSFSPPQFDGPGDERVQSPQSVKSNNSGGFRIINGVNMRTMSSSAKPKAIHGEENGSRRGSAQTDDKESNQNRRINDVMRSAGISQDAPRRDSHASSGVQSAVSGKMDVDSPHHQFGGAASNTSTVDGESGESPSMEFRYESTTSWNRRLRAEGNGWEHIFIEAWENCFKFIGV